MRGLDEENLVKLVPLFKTHLLMVAPILKMRLVLLLKPHLVVVVLILEMRRPTLRLVQAIARTIKLDLRVEVLDQHKLFLAIWRETTKSQSILFSKYSVDRSVNVVTRTLPRFRLPSLRERSRSTLGKLHSEVKIQH